MSKKKLAGIIVGCIIAIIIIAAIATPIPTPTYTLSVSVNPPQAGSVSPSGGEYESGLQITLTATPASGYTFDYWDGDASGTSPTIVITMDSDKDITAYFEKEEVRRAEPYISEVVTRDSELRELASSIVARYPGASETKEGQVNALYRYVIENFNYYSDPRGAEYIQSPYETLNIKGGDCEDLTILLCSLLENLGLRTYLVLTPDHAYALVSGINTENLWWWIEKSLEEQFLKDNPQYISTQEETFLLRAGYAYYIGGDGSKFPFQVAKVGDSKIVAASLEIDYHVKSSQPLDVYIVPSKSDYEALVRGKTFYNYPKCKKSQIYEANGKCSDLGQFGGIVLQNRSLKDSSVTLSVRFSYKFSVEDLEIIYFTLKGQKSVVLEPTAGKYGYVGYCPPYPEDTKIVAIDPITKEYFYLKF